MKKWSDFCQTQNYNPFKPKVRQVIEFLTESFHKGSSYNTLNTERCAISLISKNKIGKNDVIKRFILGCYKLKPTKSKYDTIWDIDVLLEYLEKMNKFEDLTLSELTYKTVTLLALCTAQRSQTLSKIKVKNIRDNGKNLKITITDIIKTSRPGVKQPTLILPKCEFRPNLCIYSCVKNYIARTNSIRIDQCKLFLAIKKPFKEVGSQTISRWVKLTLEKSGIDTKVFSAHSTRAASSSKAFQKGVDINVIKETANWSERSLVFAKYYNKPIIKKNEEYAVRILE